MASAPTHSTAGFDPQALPIGDDLERCRLEARERRMVRVLEILRLRRATYREEGHVPAPLGAAIRDFDHELARVRQRLGAMRRFSR